MNDWKVLERIFIAFINESNEVWFVGLGLKLQTIKAPTSPQILYFS